jgi:hypothetical protein
MMYIPESVDSLLARSEVAVIAAIHEVLYSAGPYAGLPTDANGEPLEFPPGSPLPRQPDQILALTILNVLSGTLPDGQVTAYKVDEGYYLDESDVGGRWLFFLAREPSGRWRITAAFRPEDVASVRAQVEAAQEPG